MGWSRKQWLNRWSLLVLSLLLPAGVIAQEGEATAESAAQRIDSAACAGCHPTSASGADIAETLSHSSHSFLGCLNCHQDRGTIDMTQAPIHQRPDPSFQAGKDPCSMCHFEAAAQYTTHGELAAGETEGVPTCASCHGDHDILPSDVANSKTNRANLPDTCGSCHGDINLTQEYEILYDRSLEIFESSVHGQATQGGVSEAATCNDCHSTGGSAHRILSPGNRESSINHLNIPSTCGQCHESEEGDYWEGIHGRLAARGETDSPVCTDCHGEHGIISPNDPRSPVSPIHVAQQTCEPCHESAKLNEKYGVAAGRLPRFIDSYHGLKSTSGDIGVANCASCHGVHRILPSSDETSMIHPSNLRETCGSCHPGISEELAQTPIHGVGGAGQRSAVADVVENIYILAIVVIIGLMVLHWVVDLRRHLQTLFQSKPQIRRMRLDEVWQHTLLMTSFIVLVISGFALRFSSSWFALLFFGWERGFEIRGTVHRVAAVVFILTVIWHVVFIATSRRGRQFVADMVPERRDFTQFWERILYNLGKRKESPAFGRFSYVEKAEYWALVWGTAVMAVTGVVLWFDNEIIHFLPKGFLDVSQVIHYWEAWLATLAILVWHLYSTVFNPHVYPMNPSWLTGNMPETMYRHEHPEHADAAIRDADETIQK